MSNGKSKRTRATTRRSRNTLYNEKNKTGADVSNVNLNRQGEKKILCQTYHINNMSFDFFKLYLANNSLDLIQENVISPFSYHERI